MALEAGEKQQQQQQQQQHQQQQTKNMYKNSVWNQSEIASKIHVLFLNHSPTNPQIKDNTMQVSVVIADEGWTLRSFCW